MFKGINTCYKCYCCDKSVKVDNRDNRGVFKILLNIFDGTFLRK